MDYFFIAVASVVLIALLLGLKIYSEINKAKEKQSTKKQMKNVHCPVCDSILFTDENIITKVYRPRNVPDQLITISGCPHCFPVCNPPLKRICPVCHKEISIKQSLTARLFNKAIGNSHVHILGCPNCRKSD